MTTSQEAQQEADCRLAYLDRVYRKIPYITQLDRHGNHTETFSSLLYTISHSSSWFNSFPPDIFEISRLKAAQLLAASGTVSVLCNVTVEELENQKYVGHDLKLGQEEDVGQEAEEGQEENVGQEDEGREVDVELKDDECQEEEGGPAENLDMEEDECQDEEEGQEVNPVECHADVLDDAMTSLVNFTDVSVAVRDAVRDDVSFLPTLLRKLRDWSQPYLHGELQCSLEDRLVECSLAILGNLASRVDNLTRLRDLHTLEIVLPFIRSPSDRVRLLALCALTDVATDSELQLQTFPPDIADLLLKHLTCALASNTRRYEGFGVTDLLRPLKKLAQHHSTSRLLVEQGVQSLLAQCMKETEEQMQVAQTTQNQVEAVSTGQSQMQVAGTIQNQGPAVGTGPNQLQAATDYWRSCILSYFPKLHQQTYFVPPVHFSRQAFAVTPIGNQMVYVPQPPTDQLSPQGTVQSSSQITSSPASVAPSTCLPSVTSQNVASSSLSTNLATVSAPGPSSVAPLALSTPATPLFSSSGHQHLQHPHQHHSQTSQHNSVQPVAGYVWAARPSDPTPPTARVHDSESRDDHAQQHVLHCLRTLSQSLSQAMVVVSQLQFGDYLNKPCYAPAAAQLPRPLTLATNFRRGDFDILIIHSQHGLMVGEIKSVGANMAELRLTPEKQEAVLRKKLVQAVNQLDKAETVLRHVVSDLVTSLTIRKAVMLPHITSGQLLQILKDSSTGGQAVSRAFRACLGATTDEEAVSYSLCADQLSSSQAPWDVTPHVLDQLTAWWRLRVVQSGHDPAMSPSVYEHLVARFCGPATTVRVWCPLPPRLGPRELRTEGEGVAETGERVAQLTLTPSQVDLLSRAPPRVFLSGPPGTGKTVVLTLMATEWLRQGHMVNVLGTHQQSRATAYLIERQLLHVLNATQPGQTHMVRRLQYDFSNLDRDEKKEAVEDLLKATQNGELHVIADDINGMDNFDDFCQQLVPQVPKLRLWAADTLAEVTPYGLEQQQLTAPLRCPPVVVREILLSRFFADGSIETFSDSGTAAPTDGPCIKHLQHRHQPGHEGARPEECCTCGQLVAEVLQDLHVGGMGLDISSNVNTNTNTSTSTNRDAYPTPLMFRDVLILCDNPREERREAESGTLVFSAVNLVTILREKGVAVQVVETEDEAAVRELALATRDEVAVVAWETAHGLERRVVVVMGAGKEGIHNSRLYCVSRCTAQLILIDFDLNDDESEDDNETYMEPYDDDEVVSEEDGQCDECSNEDSSEDL